MCRSGADRKSWRLAEMEVRESTEMAFEVYGEQLQTVPRFKYLGRIPTEGDDDWPAVTGNLEKARKRWVRMQRILSKEVANKQVSGNFFKAVVQQVLLFGAETWVVSPRMERALNSFVHGSSDGLQGGSRGEGGTGNVSTPHWRGQ